MEGRSAEGIDASQQALSKAAADPGRHENSSGSDGHNDSQDTSRHAPIASVGEEALLPHVIATRRREENGENHRKASQHCNFVRY